MPSHLTKILGGSLLLLSSIWWIFQGSQQIIGRPGIEDLLTVLNGALPPLIALAGIFIIWLELDEIKIEREIAKTEKKRKK